MIILLRIAQEFNKYSYFVKSIDDILTGIPVSSALSEVAIVDCNTCYSLTSFESLSMGDIKVILKDMKSVGGGVSGISKKVLCDVCFVACDRLLNPVHWTISTKVERVYYYYYCSSS